MNSKDPLHSDGRFGPLDSDPRPPEEIYADLGDENPWLTDPWDAWDDQDLDETWPPERKQSALGTLAVLIISLSLIGYGVANIQLPKSASCASIAAAQTHPASNEGEVVVIDCSKDSYRLVQSGTASRVSATQWITANHVVKSPKKDRIYLVDSQRHAHLITSYKKHPTHDLVVMKLDAKLPGDILALTDPPLQITATAIGPSAQTRQLKFTSTATDPSSGAGIMVFAGLVKHGFSGGPIISPDGKLIGMSYAIIPEAKETLAIAPLQIRELIGQQ